MCSESVAVLFVVLVGVGGQVERDGVLEVTSGEPVLLLPLFTGSLLLIIAAPALSRRQINKSTFL